MQSAIVKSLLRLGETFKVGTLHAELAGGHERVFVGDRPGVTAHIRINRPAAFFRKMVLGGANGFADAYIDGDWDSRDLPTMLIYGLQNHLALAEILKGKWPLRLAARLAHRLKPNSRKGSRRNIMAHYDLGNSFYKAWLDPSMTYSSAVFGPSAEDLETAQANKYRLICERAGLREGERVLEIGCGWGGFASYAARTHRAQVLAVTISDAQFEAARKRIFEEGLAERVTVEKRDYRDLEGQFPHVTCIEMLEAVGERYWPTFFGKLRDLLQPGGRAALQVITIEESHFERYRKSADFIQRYIFPGGMLPSRTAVIAEAGKAGISVPEDEGFAADYARTLELWRQRFDASWDQIQGLGFNERFRRIWHYYLAYCQAGFTEHRIDVRQFSMTAN